MPKNVKAKMHNKLMKAKEVYKSAPIISKSKFAGGSKGGSSIKAIDAQLMQMRERQFRKGNTRVAGKAAPKPMLIQLQPSLIAQAQQSAAEVVPLMSSTDLLLQGEGNMLIPKSAGQSSMTDDNGCPRRKTNMFEDLSDDDDEDHNNKYRLKLQPSLISSTASFNGERFNKKLGNDDVSDDDDL